MKILQVELLTDDLNATEHFYSDKLQLKLFHKSSESLSYVAGRSLLTFKRTEDIHHPVYHIAFEIPGNQLQEAIVWIRPRIKLVSFENETTIVDFDNWNAKSIYFYDDNGNILELIVRFDNNIESTKSFDASGILNISEVGLATEDVLQLSQQLINTYGLHHYEKQPARENFCALGNAEGLFVISGNERNWFPTDTKAMKYPTYIRFRENGKEYEWRY